MMGCPFAPHGKPWGDGPPSEFFFIDADGELWPVCQYDPETGDRSLIGVGEVELA